MSMPPTLSGMSRITYTYWARMTLLTPIQIWVQPLWCACGGCNVLHCFPPCQLTSDFVLKPTDRDAVGSSIRCRSVALFACLDVRPRWRLCGCGCGCSKEVESDDSWWDMGQDNALWYVAVYSISDPSFSCTCRPHHRLLLRDSRVEEVELPP
jgi:hypothetical protein